MRMSQGERAAAKTSFLICETCLTAIENLGSRLLLSYLGVLKNTFLSSPREGVILHELKKNKNRPHRRTETLQVGTALGQWGGTARPGQGALTRV